MASSVSRAHGFVAKTAAGTFASKRHCIKKATRKGRLSASIVTDLLAVFKMPKSKPTPTGPMRMQPLERGSIMPTQGLPTMPTAGKAAQTPQPKLQPTSAEAAQAAKATTTRQNSLRKQRDAQKGKMLP
jgi:hypothetical protein